jgi:hypothetical protein
MSEELFILKIGKQQYRLEFTTAAMRDVTKRYGGLSQMAGELEKLGGGAIDEFAWLIALLVNQGIAIDNDENGTTNPIITSEKVMLHMKPGALMRAKDVLMGAINEGMRHGNETDDDQDEVLNEIKNAGSAADR